MLLATPFPLRAYVMNPKPNPNPGPNPIPNPNTSSQGRT